MFYGICLGSAAKPAVNIKPKTDITMRCTNCGWSNPDDLKFCQKCNEPLIVYELHSTPLPIDIHKSDEPENISEPHVEPTAESLSPYTCRKCGYPLLPDADSCPNCGAQIKTPTNKEEDVKVEKPIGNAGSGNQMDGRATKKFSPEVVADAEKQVHSFANATVRDFEQSGGDKIKLKETMRDASSIQILGNNQAPSHITLHPVDIMGIEGEAISLSGDNPELCGALFSANNGKWEVNCTSQKAIFIQVTRPSVLESGDILIIDGKKYRVE